MSGCRPLFEALRLLARNTAKHFNESRSILLPLYLGIFITQTAWQFIYGCVVKRNMFLYDGDNLFDGLKNASLAMLAIAAVSCLLITLAIFFFERILSGWICLSCFACIFAIACCLFYHIVTKLVEDQMTQLPIVAVLTVAYCGEGKLAHLTAHLPAWFHQLCEIANCAAMVAVYLIFLPRHTAWCSLAFVAAWNVCEALSPCGPLKLALEHHFYGAEAVKRFLFRELMLHALRKDDVCERTDALLEILEIKALPRWMSERAILVLCNEMDFDMSPLRKRRTLRVCLRLIAMHHTTPFSDQTVADIYFALKVAIKPDEAGHKDVLIYEELVDDEFALPFIFDALQSTRDAKNRGDVVHLAAAIFMFTPKLLRVSLIVRYYPLLVEAFTVCLGEDRDEFYYSFLVQPEYAGILATTPTILDKLMAIVNDAPDIVDVPALSCEILAAVLYYLIEASPELLESLLGRGVLHAIMRAFSISAESDGADKAAGCIDAVLEAFPEYDPMVKRIAEAATGDNAVVRMGRSIQLRNSAAVRYDFY